MVHWSLTGDGRRSGDAASPGAASLTASERARLAELRLDRRRAEWLLGRVTAKVVVARALAEAYPGPWTPEAIDIPSEPSGRPYARLAPDAAPMVGFAPGNRLPVSVSISHTEGHALCAASPWRAPLGGRPQRVGIDLGRVEPRSRAFLDTFFTEEECAWLLAAVARERDIRANLIWCAKEAVLKVLGLGLTVDTHQLNCRPVPGDAAKWPLVPGDATWRPFIAACAPTVAPDCASIRGVWRTFPGLVAALAADEAAISAEP